MDKLIRKGTSPATLLANRANSRKSTGPVTEHGKQMVRRLAHRTSTLGDLRSREATGQPSRSRRRIEASLRHRSGSRTSNSTTATRPACSPICAFPQFYQATLLAQLSQAEQSFGDLFPSEPQPPAGSTFSRLRPAGPPPGVFFSKTNPRSVVESIKVPKNEPRTNPNEPKLNQP